ncbi:MAG: alpha/beta hydrolase [Jatrophihabitantaceae bacterium]
MSEPDEISPDLDREIASWLAANEAEPTQQTDPVPDVGEFRRLSHERNALALARMNPALIPASETESEIDGPGGALPIRVLRPVGEGPRPTVVYFHGGGWTVGDIDTHLGHARRICTQADAVVVSVAYRRAPEDRFPAAFDDAVTATNWVGSQLAELGGDPNVLVVAGDSVGGQLAASVAIARRDAGQPLSAQLLLYPVTDAAGRYADDRINATYFSRRSAAEGYGLTLRDMTEFASFYVDDADSADWRVSPLRARDLTGVAPAVVHTATLDVLRTEGNFYAQAMERAGVAVTAREWPTLNHSYFGLGGVSAVADSAAAQAAEDLRALLASSRA